MRRKKITQGRLKELLEYNKNTGIFIWKETRNGNNAKKNDIAGTNTYGYIQIQVDLILYKAHRLAWLYVYGYFPENELDHINRIKNDNRICNLREASRQCNMRNRDPYKSNKTGVTGVGKTKLNKKWTAFITNNKIKIHLGCFNNLKDAAKARWEAEKKYNYPNCNTTSTAYLYLKENCDET